MCSLKFRTVACRKSFLVVLAEPFRPTSIDSTNFFIRGVVCLH
jgi:hypothetical protein